MDHTPIIVEEFKGDYKRGAGVNVPFDHFSDSLNIKFTDKGVQSRDGIVLNNAIVVRQMFLYQPVTGSTTDRWIILSTAGANADFFDSGVSLVTPILSLSKVNVNNFSMINLYGRAYIYPFNTLTTSGMYVYDPSKSATARTAGGAKPASSVTAAASATAGNVEVGVHLFSVAYETDSGFVTKPATAVALTVAAANFSVDISTVPTGPAGTAKRHILATRRIVGYTGRPEDYELFFIPNGTIANNSGTTITVNFFDADLVDSADYLLDQFETLPSGIGFVDYNGFLVTWTTESVSLPNRVGTTIVRVSNQGQPESFSTIDGFSIIDSTDNEVVRNAFSQKGILYVLKEDRTYAIQGDLSGGENAVRPDRWPVTKIDSGKGCISLRGVAKVIDPQGSNQDYAIIASKSGLEIFDGSYGNTSLSFKNASEWADIGLSTLSGASLFCDPINKIIYVLYDSLAAVSKFILIYDYTKGLDPENIRISKWQFAFDPNCIGLNMSNTTRRPVLNVANSGWFKQSDSAHSDQDNASASVAINSYITTAYFRAKDGGLSHYNMVRSLFVGSGTLALTLIGFVGTTILNGLTLSTGPVGNIQRIFNYVGEGMAIKLGTNAIGSWFSIYPEFQVFVKKMWASRNV